MNWGLSETAEESSFLTLLQPVVKSESFLTIVHRLHELERTGTQLVVSFEIIGIDHIYISVVDLARSERFYDSVMAVVGFKKNSFANEGDPHVQYYNRHFGFVLRPARSRGQKHEPLSPGLHHFCFRVEDSATVDGIAKEFGRLKIPCSAPQLYPEYAPDYYAIFFSDPDGIQLEITNFRQERKQRFEDWANA